MRPLLPALALLALASVARAEKIVLDPVDSGTRIVTRSSSGSSTSIDRTILTASAYNGDGGSGPLSSSGTARCDFRLPTLPPNATLVSATYTMQRSRTSKGTCTVTGHAGTGDISLGGSDSVQLPSVSARMYSADVTAQVRVLIAGGKPFARYQMATFVLQGSAETAFVKTGADAPTLTIEYALPAAVFTSLGSLQSRGFYSSARALSSDGSTVIGVTDSETGDRAFVWNAARGMFDIGAGAAGASGVSGDGKVVVGTTNPGGYRWLEDGSGAWLGRDAIAAATSSDASAVVGSSLNPDGVRAVYRWTANSTERYDTYVGSRIVPAQAVAVSADGKVFVGSTLPYDGAAVPTRAFAWNSSGGQMAIPVLSGGTGESEALGVSGDGKAVVGWSYGARGPEAFLWTNAGIVGLGNLRNPDGTLGNASRANAVSPDGALVVGAAVRGGANRAFVWDQANGMQDLRDLLASRGASASLAGWTLYDATGVAVRGDGAIVVTGTGYDPLGRTQAFHATLPTTTPGN